MFYDKYLENISNTISISYWATLLSDKREEDIYLCAETIFML